MSGSVLEIARISILVLESLFHKLLERHSLRITSGCILNTDYFGRWLDNLKLAVPSLLRWELHRRFELQECILFE